nr:piggyBac transposable element-derived protein 2-like [Hydra vulgaris]
MATSRGVSVRSFYGYPRNAVSSTVKFVPIPNNINKSDDEFDFESDNDLENFPHSETLSESEFEDSSSDSSTESNEMHISCNMQSTKHAPVSKKSKSNEDSIQWNLSDADWTIPYNYSENNEKLSINKNTSDILNRFSSSIDFHKLFVTDELMGFIINQTQLYNEWRYLKIGTRRVKNIEKDELKKVIGIILYMGIMKLPNRRMYWSSSTRNELIASAMTINRFDEIMSILHFNDNNKMPDKDSSNYNKCYKVQPLIDHFRYIFSTLVNPETEMSIDEQVVPFKGAHSLKRYLPKKPKKWGYKIWARAGISGYVYDFEIEGGIGTKGPPPGCNPPKQCGESAFVVLRLSNSLLPFKHTLYFDNYFASPELMIFLRTNYKVWALSTLNPNRSRNCPILSEKEMRKLGRGYIKEFVDTNNKIVVASWFDNKRVLTLSNYIGKNPVGTCKRYDAKQKKKN